MTVGLSVFSNDAASRRLRAQPSVQSRGGGHTVLFPLFFLNSEPYRERVATTPFTPMERFFFTVMAARGASQKFPEVAANTCSAIEMQQNKPFATHF